MGIAAISAGCADPVQYGVVFFPVYWFFDDFHVVAAVYADANDLCIPVFALFLLQDKRPLVSFVAFYGYFRFCDRTVYVADQNSMEAKRACGA